MKRKHLITLICAIACVVFLLIGVLCSLSIQVTHYTVTSPNIPKSFDGFRIAHITDLHNDEFGTDNDTLISLLESAQPDIIVITGDLIDSYNTDVDISVSFISRATQIASCYYVCGNHELRMPNEYASLKKQMKAYGVTILEDRSAVIEINGESIQLTGLVDRSKLSAQQVSHLTDSTHYTVLLSHRPEHFSQYMAMGADLVFSGHAHGGQIRLPIIGALFAPGEGFLPKYADGMHTNNGTTLVVSRGLGNSSFPIRFYCPPELVIVQLKAQ